jgi:hypothetical protein
MDLINTLPGNSSVNKQTNKQTLWFLVRKRTIPIDQAIAADQRS